MQLLPMRERVGNSAVMLKLLLNKKLSMAISEGGFRRKGRGCQKKQKSGQVNTLLVLCESSLKSNSEPQLVCALVPNT